MSQHAFVIGLSLLGLTGCGGGGSDEPQVSSPSATPSPTLGAIPPGTASIEPGTYRIPKSPWSVVDFTVTFPEGWAVLDGHTYLKHPDADDEFRFYAVAVDAIYADACEGSETGDLMEVGRSVDDLAAALLTQPGPMASGPVDTTLGGYPAIRIDLSVPKGVDLEACHLGGGGLQIWYSPSVKDYFVLLPDGHASVYIVNVEGQRQVFLTQNRPATSREDLRELQAILDSIHIET